MTEPLQPLAFLAIAFVLILAQLMPMAFTADAQLWPDLLFCLAAAWVLRRPRALPALFLVAIFLLADFLLSRPPGLGALLALGATEILRVLASEQRDRPFLFEWLNFAVLYGVILLAEFFAYTITFMPGRSPWRLAELYGLTIALYPMVAFSLHSILRIRPPAAEPGWIGGVS